MPWTISLGPCACCGEENTPPCCDTPIFAFLNGEITNSSHPSCVPNQSIFFVKVGDEWVAEFECGGGTKELVMVQIGNMGEGCGVGFFVRGAHDHHPDAAELNAGTYECDPFEAQSANNNWLMLSYCGCGGVDTLVRFIITVTE